VSEPVDPTPFEPFMPPSVRALIAEARAGRGAAVEWLRGDPGTSCALLRHRPVALPAEQLGWLVGMGMFGDGSDTIAHVMDWERAVEPAPFVLSAFAAGLRAGVPTTKRQWKYVERVAAMATPPDDLCEVLPIGLASDQALARGAALRLAQKLGVRAREPIARAREGADKKAQKRLDEALAALGGEAAPALPETKASGLLARLLDAWAETRDRALEPAIARLGAEAARQRGVLKAKSKGELEGAWLALAARKDPGDVDRLLGTPWPGAWKTALVRVEALARFGPDPRIATALPEIETQYDSLGSSPFHLRAKYVAARHGGPKRSDAAAALLAEASGDTRPPVDVDAVWRAFRSEPSDERRQVLADALLTVGDPRGEYIALATAIAEERADASAHKRAAQLLDAHVDAWTGPLPGAKRSSRQFERGFLASVYLKTRAPQLLASVDAPEWCTVEELHLEAADYLGYHGPALDQLLGKAVSLQTLVLYSFGVEQLVKELTGSYPRITALGERSSMPEEKLSAFPSLRLVGTSVHWYPPAQALALGARLGLDVVLLFGVQKLAPALEELSTGRVPEARFVLGGPTAFVEPTHEGWCARVLRDEPRADLVFGRGRYQKGELTKLLAALAAAGKTEVTVTLPRLGAGDAKEEAEAFRGARVRTDGRPLRLWKV